MQDLTQPSGANFDDLKTFFLLDRNFGYVPEEFLIRQEYLQEFNMSISFLLSPKAIVF